MYCQNCGNPVHPNAAVCVKCGFAVQPQQPVYQYNQYNQTIVPAGQFDWLTTLLLCFFLGGLGVHSFYTRKTGIGIVQLLTLGGCGIWVLIDFIMILTGGFRDGNGNPLVRR